MKALSEAPAAPPSRIIAAESLHGVASFALGELNVSAAVTRHLGPRDLDNETARAAYALGRKRGFELGARTGLKQGYSEGSQALDEFESRTAANVTARMQQLVDAFRTEMAALESQVAADLVSLAVDIAREVLRRELVLEPRSLIPVASEALRTLAEGASQLEVRLNPADAGMLRRHLESVPGAQTWRLSEDAAITRGGCHIEADTGVADASFEARWQAVMGALGREEEPLP